eukprot:CAMPEP_0117686214 /NCGR_PEP_ID=MMETSP0804-20121206/22300_1 /TAXON_ID=1074897 /ORGANISM="Tetraselmis astigmatica, Strain CCMP880" /LENGTH=1054 /DNA_ID=CAMNT_0005497831 /DNA_START=599 /DNA_END=3763 /DNA_ORIENTATION=+
MLDFDFDDLDLGSRRKPTEWVAFAPPPPQRKKKTRSKPKPARVSHPGSSGPPTVVDMHGNEWASPAVQKHWDWHGCPSDGRANDKHIRINSGLYKNESRSSKVEWLPPESEEGNTEYKLRLRDPSAPRFEQLVTQMQFRLTEGAGLAYYYLGVEDNGYPRGLEPRELEPSLSTIMAMADRLDAAATVDRILEAPRGRVALRLSVRRLATDEVNYEDVRVVALGGSGAGKSTLVSVLCHGADGRPSLDDGRGAARTAVFRHKHEVETGRTSAVSQHSVGYDEDDCVVNYAGVSCATQAEVSASASKLVSLVDVGGHKKFMKTALHGLTAMVPDFAMLCLPCSSSSLDGSTTFCRMLCEHLAAAIGLDVPVFFVITKADRAVSEEVASITSQLQQLLAGVPATPSASGPSASWVSSSSHSIRRVWLVETPEEAHEAAEQLTADSCLGCVPVFTVSSVTGTGLSVLHAFLGSLQSRMYQSASSDAPLFGSLGDTGISDDADHSVQFLVGHMFEVENVGSVASGTLMRGSISVGSHLWLGPTEHGDFTRCQVTSIQRSQVPVRSIAAGQTATVALHPAGVPILCGDMCNTWETPKAWQVAGASAKVAIPAWEDCRGFGNGMSPGGSSPQSVSSLESFTQPKRSCRAPLSAADASEAATTRQVASGCDAWELLEPWQAAYAAPCLSTGAGSRAQGSDSGSAHGAAAEENGQASSDNCLCRQPSGLQRSVGSLLGNEYWVQKWAQVGMTGGAGSPSLAAEGRRGSKGAFLMDSVSGRPPQRVMEFEAEIVLLSGGHWPPRGLLSGCWPTLEEKTGAPREAEAGLLPTTRVQSCSSCSDASCSTAADLQPLPSGGASSRRLSEEQTGGGGRGGTRSQRRREKLKQRRMKYTQIVHSLSVRQAAHILSIQELGSVETLQEEKLCAEGRGRGPSAESRAAAVAAAAVMGHWDSAGSGGGAASTRCLARVRFQFAHHPEWLESNARVLVRDRTTGQLAAAGTVTRLFLAPPPPALAGAGDGSGCSYYTGTQPGMQHPEAVGQTASMPPLRQGPVKAAVHEGDRA